MQKVLGHKQKIELTNDDSWFLNMITPYLDKYLGVSTLEEAETELDKDYPSIGKRGRKRENAILDTVSQTVLKDRKVGAVVNLETDIIGKYYGRF